MRDKYGVCQKIVNRLGDIFKIRRFLDALIRDPC